MEAVMPDGIVVLGLVATVSVVVGLVAIVAIYFDRSVKLRGSKKNFEIETSKSEE